MKRAKPNQADVMEDLRRFLSDIQNLRYDGAIDVEIEWPPPEEGVHLIAVKDMLVHGSRPTVVGRHFVDSVAWDRKDIDRDDIYALLIGVAQRGPRRLAGGPTVYLRVHDTIHSVLLTNGHAFIDRKRPDYRPAPRLPVRVCAGAPPQDPREGQELRRGQSIRTSESLLSATASTPTVALRAALLEVGIRVALEQDDDTILHVTYIRPYPRKVCGVWIGASASEVQEILGPPADEALFGQGTRGWIYEHDGHLFVGFDSDDRVDAIGR